MIPSTNEFLSFDATRIAWTELGEGNPIILLHGLFSTGHINWQKFGAAAEIAGAGYRVVMPDFRAHGASAAPPGAEHYPPDVLAMDIEALVRHLDLREFDLCGYSLGARTAVRLLVRGMHPQRVVLGGMGLAGLTGGAERAKFFLNVIANRDSFATETPEYAASQFMKQNGVDADAVAHVLRSQQATSIEVLRGLDTPTLVVCGVHDQDNGSAPDLALTLPRASCLQIPGNHMSAVTKPDFGTAIAAWLQHQT